MQLAAREASNLKWKVATIVLSCGLFGLLLAIFVYAYVTQAFGLRRLDAAAVVIQVKQLKELVTVRYTIQRVVGLREPKEPFGEESILLMVQGEADAGVDLGSLTTEDVTHTGRRQVTIRLPPAKLFSASLDEKQTRIWDRHITWWTPWVPYDPELEHRARLQGIEDVRNAALGMGILDQAQKNAQSAIRDFLKAIGVDTNFQTRPLD